MIRVLYEFLDQPGRASEQSDQSMCRFIFWEHVANLLAHRELRLIGFGKCIARAVSECFHVIRNVCYSNQFFIYNINKEFENKPNGKNLRISSLKQNLVAKNAEQHLF